MADQELRDALQCLTESLSEATLDQRWKAIVMYGGPHRLARLRDGLPNNRYNCFAYAFDVYARADYQQLADVHAKRSKAPIDPKLVKHMVETGTLVEHREELQVGDIVLYENEGEFVHAARVVEEDGLCHSKWGIGHLYQHGVWEVPTSYGRRFRTVYSKGPDTVMDVLKRWLAAQTKKGQ
jgi:hypothetical protein